MIASSVQYADGPCAGKWRLLQNIEEIGEGLRFVDLDEGRVIHRYVVEGDKARLVESLPLDEYTGGKGAA